MKIVDSEKNRVCLSFSKTFKDGKYVFHPLCECDILYCGCPRKVFVLLNRHDYTDCESHSIYNDLAFELGRIYPDYEMESSKIHRKAEFLEQQG